MGSTSLLLLDTIAVIPFVDMLNHDPSAQVCWQWMLPRLTVNLAPFQCLATFERYKNKYVVRASHYVHDDQQVTVCYGPHDNARLWIEYGFTLPNNPNGKVALEHGTQCILISGQIVHVLKIFK